MGPETPARHADGRGSGYARRPMSGAPWRPESSVNLRIRFAEGERPHLFWVSARADVVGRKVRYKILSKRRPDSSIEVIVIEEGSGQTRRCLKREDVPAGTPAGWLSRWVSELASSLGIRFHCFDLREIESEAEWQERTERLGWTRGPRGERVRR